MKYKFRTVKGSKILFTLAAIVLAFVICGLFVLALGYNPFNVYRIIFEGSLGSKYSILKSLTRATPLIFTGLSVFFADQAGLFNIGAEGQLAIGALTSGIFAYQFSQIGIPPFLAIILTLIVAFLSGAVWGAIPGILRARFNANEFIVSMMLNYVAASFCEYMVTYPFRGNAGSTPMTATIPESYQLTRFTTESQLNFGLVIGLIAIIAVWLYFRFTSSGYEARIMGKNNLASLAAGVNTKSKTVFVFAISGGIAALAGATEVLGIHGFFMTDISPGYGFDGIAVSVLSQGNTFGVLLSSLLFGALSAGGSRLDMKSKVPSEFIDVLQAVVIVLIATPKIIEKLHIGKRKEE